MLNDFGGFVHCSASILSCTFSRFLLAASSIIVLCGAVISCPEALSWPSLPTRSEDVEGRSGEWRACGVPCTFLGGGRNFGCLVLYFTVCYVYTASTAYIVLSL